MLLTLSIFIAHVRYYFTISLRPSIRPSVRLSVSLSVYPMSVSHTRTVVRECCKDRLHKSMGTPEKASPLPIFTKICVHAYVVDTYTPDAQISSWSLKRYFVPIYVKLCELGFFLIFVSFCNPPQPRLRNWILRTIRHTTQIGAWMCLNFSGLEKCKKK